MKEDDVSKLKVAELKEELRSRELSVTGLKADLAKRLLEAVRSEAQEEKAVDAEDGPAEEGGDAAGPEAVPGGSKEDVEVPQPAGKANENHVPADAAQQEPKEETSTKQADQASTVALDTESKNAEGDFIEKRAATPVSHKEPEAPAAAATLDEKPDEKSNYGHEEAIAGTAADKSVGESKVMAQESDLDKHAIKHLAGDSAPAPSMPQKKQLTDEPAATTAEAAAVPQAAADESAAPQVNVLGSVEVAAPLQETAEEELDYEADEVMEQAAAPASDKADAKGGEGARKKRPADSEGVRSSKAQKAEGSERGKREPIAFKPRDSGASGSGRSAENGQREASADLKRTGSQTEKRSVFERLHSGAGKDASTPRRAPPSREAASRALLITGFVRPFTEPMARQMLSETGEIQGFWMPKIKDRAYIIYASEEEAEATRNAVSGIEWPTGNANSLRPKFVSWEDAERTVKTGQPPEMRMEVSATATAPQPARAVAAPAAAAEPARAAPARPGAPLQNGPAAELSKPKDMREILEERRRARDGKRAPAAAPADARPKPAAPQPVIEPEPMEEEPEPKALEELFRKTETKPWLYWLSLTEEQVAEKAARDAAQLPGPPAKPVRQ